MPETLIINNFSAGWCPNDDTVNGRPNCCLEMDNLEIDRNGGLILTGGTEIIQTGYVGSAHTLYSRFINGIRHDYAALDDGAVRDNQTILIQEGQGDDSNAAFGTAYNYTLICSGPTRMKHNGVVANHLGVSPPNQPPLINQSEGVSPIAVIGSMTQSIVIPNGTSVSIGGQYIQNYTDAGGLFTMQTYPGTVHNLNVLSGPAGTGTATDKDFVIINGYAPWEQVNGVSFQFDVLLVQPNASGNIVSDYYSYAVENLARQAQFDTFTGAWTLRINRTDFTRVGGAALDWTTVYGFRISINNHQNDITLMNIWAAIMGSDNFFMQGGTTAQFGTYQYAQMNVNNTGSYLAKSTLGPISNPIKLDGRNAIISFQNPTNIDPQVNEVWIFRNGGNIGGTWYRIAVIYGPSFTPNPVYDSFGDQMALDTNITANINLISIQSIGDKIYDIVGPIQARWYYFTTNFMYPSEQGSPDSVDPTLAVRTSGSASELFLWARAVSASVVIIGTSLDCYLLTGTFTTFPDGSIDIYYQALGVKFPPVTYDAVAYGGAVYYLGFDGWRVVLPTSFGTTYSTQNNQLLVSPNLDRLYRGETCYSYNPPVMKFPPGSIRYPITIAKNKMWCFINQTNPARIEVYDFVRQYWFNVKYGLGDVTAATTTQDGRILAFFGQIPLSGGRILREINTYPNKTIDGVNQQFFGIFMTYRDNGKPRQRKDTYTFKSRCWLENGYMQIKIIDEMSRSINFPIEPPHRIYAPVLQEVFVDLSQGYIELGIYPKSYALSVTGTGSEAFLSDFSIDFDARPNPLTFLKIQPSNLGVPQQKRIRTWPLVIDTLGNDVIFRPDIDCVPQTPTIFNTDCKKTVYAYFLDDVNGVDYGGTLYDPKGLMEIWDTGVNADGSGGALINGNVQTYPLPKRFDQVGPSELFRYGKIVRIALRTIAKGTPIPFIIYFSDGRKWDGKFNVTPNAEDDYVLDVPKGTNGRILRVTLGPTDFDFNRYYMRFQVATSGGDKDTELQWYVVAGQQ